MSQLSSEAATQKILQSAGLTAGSIEGLGEVTTAEEFVQKLPGDDAVWLTFSNMAYLHFAQNWYMQVVPLFFPERLHCHESPMEHHPSSAPSNNLISLVCR